MNAKYFSFQQLYRGRNIFAARLIAGLLAALVNYSMLCTQANAQTMTVVNVAAPPFDVAGNLFYAIDRGYFTKAGVDVKLTTMTTSAPIVAAVASGAIDIGIGSTVPIAAAHLAGVPLVIFAPSGANAINLPIDGIVVPKNSAIRSAKDLDGKTIGTSGLQGIAQVQALAWIDKNGGDWKTIKFVEIPPPQEAAATIEGRTDAGVISEPFLSAGLQTGNLRLLAYPGSAVSRLVVEGGVFCTADFAKAHPDLIRKFARAVLDAGLWANSHHEEARAIMAKYTKSTMSVTGEGHSVFAGSLKPSDLQSIIDLAAKFGAIRAAFPASDLVIDPFR